MNNVVSYDSFPKFIASIGLTLCIIPIVAMHFYLTGAYVAFQNSNFSIEQNGGLASIVFPIILIAAFIVGLALIIFACRKWKLYEDRVNELDIKSKEIDVEDKLRNSASEKEREEKDSLEAAELSSSEISKNTESEETALIISGSQASKSARNVAYQSETLSVAYITAHTNGYFFARNRKVSHNGTIYVYDLVGVPFDSAYPTRVYEFKRPNKLMNLRKRVVETTAQSFHAYQQEVEPQAHFFFWVVADDEDTEQNGNNSMRRLTSWFNDFGFDDSCLSIRIVRQSDIIVGY